MNESEEFDKEKYTFVIYHGHIHVLSNHNNNRAEDEEVEKVKFTPVS